MYCSHFGLHRPPFNNTPDPTFYFSTSEHEEALATLRYATEERKGFVLVTGEVGAGKTLTGRMFLRQIETEAETAVITHTHLSGRQLLAAICTEFGLNPRPDASNLELTQILQDFLLEQYSRNRYVVVLIDEAQNLSDEAFEELRMLGNLEADDAKLLQVCILGQPELRNRFAQTNLRQLEQRLFRRFHLTALSPEETQQYILHRLRVAGCKDAHLFTPEAIEQVFLISRGIPRLINQLCDNALLAAYAEGIVVVDARTVREMGEREQARTSPPLPGAIDEAAARRVDRRQTLSPRTTTEMIGGLAQSVEECVQAIVESSVDAKPTADAPSSLTEEPPIVQSREPQGARPCADQPAERPPASHDQPPRAESARATEPAAIRPARAPQSQPPRSRIAEIVDAVRQRCARNSDKTERPQPQPPAGSRISPTPAAASRQMDRLREHTDELIKQLSERLRTREEEISILNDHVNAQFDTTQQMIKELQERSTTSEELQHAKAEQAQVVAELNQKLAESSAALKDLRASIDERLKAAAAPTPEFQALSRRVIEQAQQVQELRKKLLNQYTAINQCLSDLNERLVSRAELDDFRAIQVRQNDEVLDKIESNREAVQEMLDDLAERYRTTRDQVEALVAAKVDSREFSEFQARQDEEVSGLLEMLKTQRREIEERFDQTASRWKQTQCSLEHLTARAADAKAVEEIRRRQAQDAERVLATVSAHRREFEHLVKAVKGRCDELVQRFNALPKEIATTDQLNAIRTAYMEQVGNLMRHLAAREADLEKTREQQERGLRAVAGKALETAKRVSILEEKGRPRRVHLELTPKAGIELGDMVISAQAHGDLLRTEVGEAQRTAIELRETSTAIDRTIQDWQERVDGIWGRAREMLQNWTAQAEEARAQANQALGLWETGVAEVRQESERLRTSAKMAAEILVKMRRCNSALDAKLGSDQWQGELKRSEELVARLEQASGTAQTLSQQLAERASSFRNDLAQQMAQYKKELSDRLEQAIAAARTTAQQLTDRIAWSRNELTEQMNECRAELVEQLSQCKRELADRMVQFTAEQKRIDQAMKERLAQFTAEQAHLEQVIENRRQTLTNIAKSAGSLAEVIESSRQFDENRQPAVALRAPQAHDRETRIDSVEEIRWPRLRTHKAQAI